MLLRFPLILKEVNDYVKVGLSLHRLKTENDIGHFYGNIHA